MSDYLGLMYLAIRPCGKVSAAAWDDGFGSPYERRNTLGEWAARGDTVRRMHRHKGDPQPDWMCATGDPCACREGERESDYESLFNSANAAQLAASEEARSDD